MFFSSLFESIFNSSLTGQYLLSPTPEATILAVNDAFLKAASRKREELIGVSLFAAFPGNPDDSEDSGEAVLRNSLARVIATGKPDTMPAQRYPIRVEKDNGEIAYEERFWSASNTPIFDDDGQVACISHSTTDITEQVQSAAALRESERRFRALTNATADVVYRMSPDWTQMQELDGRGFLQDTAALAEYRIENYVPPEDQELVRNAINEGIRNKAVFALEHRVLRVDGSYGWTYSKAVPLLDADGEIYEWIGAASDITSRKKAEQQLIDADRRKDEFLAMLAHELRNPLAPIGAAAELLGLVTLDEERIRQTSQVITRQVDHMTGLINDLLDVSRVTRGLIELDAAPIDIRHVANEAVEQVTPLIRTRRHRLTIQSPPETTMVTGDKKRLIQVMVNILNNAAKYTPEGGNIVLEIDVQLEHVALIVRDDGIGMTPELATRAYELFSQAERSADRSLGGLGIGLALVKSLAELHGGAVSCWSEGIGYGSQFTVTLPRLIEQNASLRSVEKQPQKIHATQSLRILLVDDNVDAATMLAMYLGALGHEVMVEHSAYRALEQARIAKPEVLLLDIGLPEMDGNALAHQLRLQPENANSTLIAITGYGQDRDRRNSLKAGFDHHLVKPVDTKRLTEILDGINTK
jgi:signal transduction histidine kinase